MFELFNLGNKPGAKTKKEVPKEEILTMLYNLPNQGVIVGTFVKETQKYDYRGKK